MIAAALLAAALSAPPQPETLKVFVLAGQSNMQGHGFISADPERNGGKGSLEQAARNPASPAQLRSLLASDGSWRVRDDVWIHYMDRKGPLTVGYGVGQDVIGPELGFGGAVGDALHEPVLLIKVAWGGKSLAVDFRPPSAGGEVGPNYTELVARIRAALSSIEADFPALKGRRPQLAGFGWHQGWNDRIDDGFVAQYEQNMVHFIKDIRKDLAAPGLPFVIAETGMGGMAEEDGQALALMRAQEAATKRPETGPNAAFVGTRAFWRTAEQSPVDALYHWNNNGETYFMIGDAMGRAMNELMKRGQR
jgi:alpha-galactosidase